MINKINKVYFFVLCLTVFSNFVYSQTLQEIYLPQYSIGKTATSTHTARLPFIARLKITGLTPNTIYNVDVAMDTTNVLPSTFGAGNVWSGISYSGQRLDSTTTVSDASGNLTFWAPIQPTGNSRFEPFGDSLNPKYHGLCFIKIKYRPSGTSSFIDTLVTTNFIKFLDCSQTARTVTTIDDGAFIKGIANTQASGKFILTYDNISGTGRPISCYRIEQNTYDEVWSSQTSLPPSITGADTSTTGFYAVVIPSNNPNGIRRIEARQTDGTLTGLSTNTTGQWPSGANTINPSRYSVVNITSSDAPLNTISVRNIKSVATKFYLSQNYPNPFNPITKIYFSIPSNGFVNLKIYDLLGREIVNLFAEEFAQGEYCVYFNGDNLSSGTYFYKLEYKGNNGKYFTGMKKLVLIK